MPRADARDPLPDWWPIPVAALAVVAGLAFRFWHLTGQPLWLDEGYSAYAASKGFAFLWKVVPLYETHPPFYYSLLRLWTLLCGDGLGSLRALGALCGVITIAGGIAAARSISNFTGFDRAKRIVMMSSATMLVALSLMPIEMARNVRPYALLILVYSLIIALLFVIGSRLRQKRALWSRSYAAYLLLLTCLLWLHNLGVLYAGAVGIAFLILCWRRSWIRKDWMAFVGGHLAVAAAWLPALIILSSQAPTWISSTWLQMPPAQKLWFLSVRLFVAPRWDSMLPALALVLLAWWRFGRQSEGLRAVSALSVLAFLPLLASLAISFTIAPVFIPRTMAALAIPAMLLLALGVTSAAGGRRVLGWILLVPVRFEMTRADITERRRGPPEDWYRIVDWLGPRFAPGDVVLAYPNEGALPLRFALRDKHLAIPVRPIPTDMPTLDGGPGAWNPTGSRGVFSLPESRLQQIADAPDVRSVPTVWLLRQGPWAYDKGDHFLHALERSRVQVGHVFTFPIDLIGLRRKDLAPLPPAEQPKP